MKNDIIGKVSSGELILKSKEYLNLASLFLIHFWRFFFKKTRVINSCLILNQRFIKLWRAYSNIKVFLKSGEPL
jgi:hypothetical protein